MSDYRDESADARAGGRRDTRGPQSRGGATGPHRDARSDAGRSAPDGGLSRQDRREHRSASPRHRTAARPSERSRAADVPRRIAYDLLRAIDDGAYANLELPKRLRQARLGGRDAGFVTELVYGATRMRGFYDPILARCSGRDVAAIDPEVLDVLRLGAHQSLSMRVRQHAAVGETVALAREVVGAGRAGFVNAVLRRVSEKDLETWRGIVAGDAVADPAERLAIEHSHPAWVVRALRAALLGHGASTPETVDADLVALLEADNDAPAVSLVARPGLADVGELLDAGAHPSRVSPVGAILSGGDPGDIRAVRDGRAAVQDEGSQLIPLALVAAPRDAETPSSADTPRGDADREADADRNGGNAARAGERWLDLCAGPGGKAALLASLALRDGAVLFANEASDHRTRLVHQAVAAAVEAGAEVMVGTGDGRDIGAEEPGEFDRVLVDAPCTGLGALRRRPEARWRRAPDDVGDLARLQGELLASALDAAAPGGLVGYATCSPHLAETRFVVGDALKRRDDVEAVDARALFRDADGQPIEGLGDGPYVQLWPHVHGSDAMFFALLRKTR